MRHALGFGLGALIWVVACGSSKQDDLFKGSGGSSGSTGGSGGSASGGVGGVGGATTGGTGGVGASGGSTATGGTSAQGGSAGVGGAAGEAGTGATGGDGATGGSGAAPGVGSCWGHCGSNDPVPTSSGADCYCDNACTNNNDCCADYTTACGPAGTGQVNCLSAGSCNTQSSFCCMAWMGNEYVPKCVPGATSCEPGADVRCDGPEDCSGGQVCCGQWVNTSGGGFWAGFDCRNASECGNWPNPIICGNNPGVCNGDPCRTSSSIPQIHYCDPG